MQYENYNMFLPSTKHLLESTETINISEQSVT